jgi:hypothetical protein
MGLANLSYICGMTIDSANVRDDFKLMQSCSIITVMFLF